MENPKYVYLHMLLMIVTVILSVILSFVPILILAFFGITIENELPVIIISLLIVLALGMFVLNKYSKR